MEMPDVKFVESGGYSIAWQEWGNGPSVLVIPALVSNVEVAWEHEFYRRAFELISDYCHIVHFDKRGIGLSDKSSEVPTLDERIGDMIAVLDAAGIERASLVGMSEGGLMAQFFACFDTTWTSSRRQRPNSIGCMLRFGRTSRRSPTRRGIGTSGSALHGSRGTGSCVERSWEMSSRPYRCTGSRPVTASAATSSSA